MATRRLRLPRRCRTAPQGNSLAGAAPFARLPSPLLPHDPGLALLSYSPPIPHPYADPRTATIHVQGLPSTRRLPRPSTQCVLSRVRIAASRHVSRTQPSYNAHARLPIPASRRAESPPLRMRSQSTKCHYAWCSADVTSRHSRSC
ncbi:hypothetical protein C8J57DRAFT_1535283 [Mycena rebaudengoi]|nr:hypothetical protein C8J57DRAFT_1535283 [Mycena rebaudengoi]